MKRLLIALFAVASISSIDARCLGGSCNRAVVEPKPTCIEKYTVQVPETVYHDEERERCVAAEKFVSYACPPHAETRN